MVRNEECRTQNRSSWLSFCTLHSLFCTSLSAPGGNRTHSASRAAGLQPAWRTTAHRRRSPNRSGTDTGGSRTHKPKGLSPVAIPVRVPCRRRLSSHLSKSPRWESNPRFRHTRTAGSRYNTGAFLPEPPVGIEPTLPRYEGGRLPLQHGGRHSEFIPHPFDRERLAGVEPAPPTWHADVLPLTPQARRFHLISSFIPRPSSLPQEHPAGLEPASPAWEVGMFPLHHGCTRTSGTRRT